MFDLFRVLSGSKLVTADSCPREHVMREPDLYQSVIPLPHSTVWHAVGLSSVNKQGTNYFG